MSTGLDHLRFRNSGDVHELHAAPGRAVSWRIRRPFLARILFSPRRGTRSAIVPMATKVQVVLQLDARAATG